MQVEDLILFSKFFQDPMAKFARPKSMEYRSKPDKNAVPDPKFQPFRRKEPEKVSPSSKKENHSQSHR